MQTVELATNAIDEKNEKLEAPLKVAVDEDPVEQAVNKGKRKLSKTDSHGSMPAPAKDNKENATKKSKAAASTRPTTPKMLPTKSTTDVPSGEIPPPAPKQVGRPAKNAAKKSNTKPVPAVNQPTIQAALKVDSKIVATALTKDKKEEATTGKPGSPKKALQATVDEETKPDAPVVTKDKKEETTKGKQGPKKKAPVEPTPVGETKMDAPTVTKDKKEETTKGKQGPKKKAPVEPTPVGETKMDAPTVTKDKKEETTKGKPGPKKKAPVEPTPVGETKMDAPTVTKDKKEETAKRGPGSPKKTPVKAAHVEESKPDLAAATKGTEEDTTKGKRGRKTKVPAEATPVPATAVNTEESTVKDAQKTKVPAEATPVPATTVNAEKSAIKDALKKKRMLNIEKSMKAPKKAKKQSPTERDTRSALWDKAALIADVGSFTVVCELKLKDGVRVPHAVIYRKDCPAIISLETARVEHPLVGEKYDALEKEMLARFDLAARS